MTLAASGKSLFWAHSQLIAVDWAGKVVKVEVLRSSAVEGGSCRRTDNYGN